MKALPNFVERELASCPQSGGGVHSWLYKTARVMHHCCGTEEITERLAEASARCGRGVPRSEIAAAVQASARTAWLPRESRPPLGTPITQSRWPKVDQPRAERIAADGPGLADLWEQSPVRFDDDRAHTEEIIDAIFPHGALICAGASSRVFDTEARERWTGLLVDQQFIVPSPMSKVIGVTKEGKESKHTLDNTGPRRFAVIEFDSGTPDSQASRHWHLRQFAPLCLIVHSGSKSVHGWYFVAGWPEEKVHPFYRYAVSIGADHATFTRSQFVRMPDGTRDNGKRQTVFYFNPKAIR